MNKYTVQAVNVNLAWTRCTCCIRAVPARR